VNLPAESKAPGPIRVVRVDVGGPLPEVSPFRDGDVAGGGGAVPYVGAWVIVLRSGVPVGHVELPLAGRVVSSVELREALVSALGDVFSPGPVVGVVADSGLPVVSVVVPSTFDRVALLERCVASLVAQDYPAFEVIVVDNRPEVSEVRAGFWARLGADSRVSVVAESRPGSSAARNCGVASAVGEVVAFIDDDVEVESGWLRAIGSRFAGEPQTDCVTGLVLPKELETPAQIWFERSGSKIDQHYEPISFGNDGAWRGRFLGSLRPGRFQVAEVHDGVPRGMVSVYSGKYGMSANIAFRTAAYRALGGFNVALGAGIPSCGGEDLLLISRLLFSGRTLTFDPHVFVFHTHRRSLAELKRQLHGYGVGYTAMLFALVLEDWRHVAGLIEYVAQVSRLMLRRSEQRQAGDYPSELAGVESRGLLKGPWAYIVSRRFVRKRGGVTVALAPEAVVTAG
jgi:glycosyltransferase involved in cell wall biosynthesis